MRDRNTDDSERRSDAVAGAPSDASAALPGRAAHGDHSVIIAVLQQSDCARPTVFLLASSICPFFSTWTDACRRVRAGANDPLLFTRFVA